MELVGPAGVGKTTLARTIERANSTVQVGLSLWQVPPTRLVQGALALVPTIVVSALRKRRLRWREIRHMIRLDALRHALPAKRARDGRKANRIILLDEGPVFGIGWLDVAFAERGIRAPARWRRRVLRRWARLIDSVVRLDAGNRVLANRMRTRTKRHRMATRSDASLRRFADVFRTAYDAVIEELSSVGPVTVRAVRTDGPLNRSAARLSAALELPRHGH